MNRNQGILHQIDWITVGLYFLLVILGWLNIYAAVFNEDHRYIFDVSQRYGMQLIWIVAALMLIVVIFSIDSRFFSAFPYPMYLLMILTLIFVLIFGRVVNGSKSWIEIGMFRLQPAEFAKLATALTLAKFASVYNFKLNQFRNLLIVSAIIGIPAVLILLQNDTGSTLVFATFSLVLYREGLPGWILVMGVVLILLFVLALLLGLNALTVIIFVSAWVYLLAHTRNLKISGWILLPSGIAYLGMYLAIWFLNLKLSLAVQLVAPWFLSFPIYLVMAYKNNIKRIYGVVAAITFSLMFIFSVDYVFHNILIKHQRDRINNLLGIEFDPLGAGYNVNQSMIAIGSGGAVGKGFLQGTQTKYNFVPEQSTDFIFCTVGEEWGFVGSALVLLLFLGLLFRIIFLAERQKSKFTRIYGYGVAAIFFFHILVNVGMTIGLAPVIGIPLPFFSYGGSSLWAFTILLFILVRLDVSRDQQLN